MKFSLICLILAVTFMSTDAIINGQPWFDAPYAVHIRYRNVAGAGAQAGGVIISHRHILTSGLGVQPSFTDLDIRVGGALRSAQQRVFADVRAVHGSYSQLPRMNDIAILRLNATLTFSRFIQPIRLPELNEFHPMENEQLTILGFGGFPQNSENRDLEAAFMRTTSNQRCSQVQANPPVQINPLLQFCAVDVSRRSDFCFDDVGGAVIAVVRGQEVLVGLQSVQRCQTNPGAELLPSLFTRITGYRAWIRDTMLSLA